MKDENKKPCLTSIYLTGPPGSGKTQLARQFGESFLNDTPGNDPGCTVVLTINVRSIESSLVGIEQLLQSLHLNVVRSDSMTTRCDNDDINLLKLYVEKLREILSRYPGEWLLIFDDIFEKKIAQIIPQSGHENWGNGKILLTTQNNDLAPPVCHMYAEKYSLEEGLGQDDALSLLEEISKLERDKDDFALTLTREMGSFPLPLACAATYVGQMIDDRGPSCYSWRQFVEHHRKQADMKFPIFEESNRRAKSSTVLLHAFQLLSYCTTNPIPSIIVSEFVKASLSCDDLNNDEIIAEISRCCLLSKASSSFEAVESVKFHQVMREGFIHVRNDHASKLTTENYYLSFLRLLQKSLEKAIPDYNRDNVVLKKLISSHLKSIIDFGEDHQWTEHAEFVVIQTFLADCLYHVPGVTKTKRISYCKSAYKIARLLIPMNIIPYCQLHRTLGFYYREKGDYENAVRVLKEGLGYGDRVKRENNEDWKRWIQIESSLLNVLAWTYKLQLKFDAAEQTMNDSIELAKKAFGKDHQEIITRYCNLAVIYREKKDASKAKETVDKARKMTEPKTDEAKTTTNEAETETDEAETTTDERKLIRAQAVNFSGKIYLYCAQTTDSEDKKKELLHDSLRFHAEALTIYENVYGKYHIYVAGVSRTYGLVHKELNDYNLALEYVERAEKIYWNADHIELSAALRSITEVFRAATKKIGLGDS